MSCHIFTYGSLMFPRIWERVVLGRYSSRHAVLCEHARYAVESETYPGMIAQSSMTVQGVLYCAVSDEDVTRLDVFEGRDYRREKVQVLLDDGEVVPAQTYIYTNLESLSNLPWQPEAFQMQRFFDIYCNERLMD